MMKVLRLTGAVALLVLSWGCGGGDTGGEVPSEVASILSANCQSCHGDPPANGAPIPIMTCNDILGQSSLNSGATVLEEMQTRINSSDSDVMPPSNAGELGADQLATLNDWLDDGAPGCE